MTSPIYTKESLIQRLYEIIAMGWIPNMRTGNVGGIGNTLEDLLGIAENNLPIPNAAEWELKSQRKGTTALITLLHSEPSPQAMRFVPKTLLPMYGWQHKEAGKKYPETEKSFRQTINGVNRTDRGFGIQIDRDLGKIMISFDSSQVSSKHTAWLKNVDALVGLDELDPQPYWGIDDLSHSAGVKLKNTFFVVANRKRESGIEYFQYEKFYKLSHFNIERFLDGISNGNILIDFDARTGHNHGTKFRMRQNYFPFVYDSVEEFKLNK